LVIVDALVEARILLVEDVARCYQASGKLLYVVLRVFRTLAAKGVCSNEEEEVEGDGKGMSFEDDVEGTGMGEGDGKKDVSDQIENEDQLSGLKNEEQKDKDEDQEKEKQDKEEDKAIEMTQDFAGEMEDISDDENEDEDQDDGDEREELEREMGECNEEDVVDEKQWDEKEDEVSGEEKMEKDSKTQGQEIEGEMTTKDDDDDDDGGKNEKEKEKEEGRPEEEKEKDKDKPELDAGDDEGPEAGAAGADEDGGEDPQQEPNAGEEEMETPAGMDVREEEEKDEGDAGDDADGQGEGEGEGEGEDEEEKGEGEGEEGADGPGAELGDDDNGDDDGEGEGDELPENMQLDGDDDAEGGGDDDDDEANEDGEDPDAMAVEEDDDEGEGPEDKPDDADEGAGVTGAGNMPENEVPEPEEPERGEDDGDMEVDPAAAGEDEGLPDAFGVQSNAGKEAVLGADEAEGEGGEMNDDEDEEAPTPTGGSSGDGGQQEDAGDASGADHASGARPEEQRRAGTSKDDVPNPLREQGDVNEKWHRRLNVEMRSDQDAGFEDPVEEEAADGSRKDTYEYAGQEEGGTEQVLADADQEESGTQLPEGGETEREEEEDKDKRNGEEDADEDGPAVDVDGEGKEKKSRSLNGPPAPKQKDEDVAVPPEGGEDADELDDKDGDGDNDLVDDDADEDVPMDFPEAENRDAAPTRDGFTSKAATDGAMEVDDDRGEGDDEADERLDERAAAALVEAWRDDARVDDGGAARALWAKYRSATDAHSIRLCEQLRLILEPSLATRLQGDYRTGKRINMKKVIGFIASGFRKDKIWLRRTKPAKRDYQVMLMIDDSSSMGQAGPLALASMATIANALTKLEVGEMSVASFADDVSILHPFGRPFTDDVGADVFQHFKFQASTTRLGASLETCMPLFEQARDSSASSAQSTTLQLCFVISDARIDTDNRDDLQALVRRMAEKHILVVLIIIDKNADDKESVFNTQSVSFTPQGIVMRSYMDNFPFQFYLTISDLDRLPDILCDALKQWFEMVRAQLDSR
jgi:midasin